MAAGGGVDECVRAAFEDVLHDVGGWFLSVYWVGLVVRVRRSGAVVMAVIDGGGLWCSLVFGVGLFKVALWRSLLVDGRLGDGV